MQKIPETKQNKNDHQNTEIANKKLTDYRHIYPEFLPDPAIQFRNSLREKLERTDMIARRSQVDIPEFYVG